MATVVAHDSLRAAGGAARVQHVERIVRSDGHAGGRLRPGNGLVPVDVAALLQLPSELRALQEDHVVGPVPGERDRLVHHRLVGDRPARLEPARAADDELRPRMLDARGELVRGKAAEDHRMHGADARAAEHGDQRLRNHRHVDDDPIALAHSEPSERSGESRRLLQQLPIRVLHRLVGHRAVPDERELIAPAGLHVYVEGVLAGVQLAPFEPARALRIVPVEHPLPGLAPAQRTGSLIPERFRFLQGPAEDLLVAAHDASVERTLREPHLRNQGRAVR